MKQKMTIEMAMVISLLVGSAHVYADVHLAPVFGSNMVLQRDVPAKLVGWAEVGEMVTVKLGEKVVGQVAGTGKEKPWTVLLPVQKAGPVPDITVVGKNSIVLTNLLAGDVWVCSGQSNMAQSLQRGEWCGYGGVLDVEKEVVAASHPTLRLMKSPGGNWEVCSPESAKSFSAAGYFFGRELTQRLNVPVGLITAAVGGTMAELWVPRVMREGTPEFVAELEEARRTQEELKKVAKCTWDEQDRLTAAQHTQDTGQLYTRMIAPLTELSIKGTIWYQGEGNTRKASAYERLMSLLIQGWRKEWGQGDFPFIVMQLVNFHFRDEPWQGKATFAALREAQQALADHVPNTGLAVGIDIGEANNIHPRNKQEVGRRLALVALKQVYKQEVIAAGPALTDARFEPGRATLSFDAGGKGQNLVFKDAVTNGFELAGADGKFVPATAHVNGNTIVLTTAEITTPCSVRYAWADNPPATVFNTAGLPAAPFRKTAPVVMME